MGKGEKMKEIIIVFLQFMNKILDLKKPWKFFGILLFLAFIIYMSFKVFLEEEKIKILPEKVFHDEHGKEVITE
jgi:hypothetical protein